MERESDIESQVNQLVEDALQGSNRVKADGLPQLEKALALALQLGNNNLTGKVKLKIASYHVTYVNDYLNVVSLAQEAYDLLDAYHQKIWAYEYYRLLGIAYYYLSDEIKANKYYLLALKAIDESDMSSENKTRSKAHTYFNLFVVSDYSIKEPTEDDYYNRSLAFYQEVGDQDGISNCYNAVARVYFNRGDYAQALEYMLASLELNKQTTELSNKAYYLSNIALIYCKLNEFDKWESFTQQAKAVLEVLNSPRAWAIFHNHAGNAYLDFKKYDLAIEHFAESLRLVQEIGEEAMERIQHNYLFKAYRLNGQFEQACAHAAEFERLVEKSMDHEKDFAVARARSLFELEQKEKETELLRGKNREIEDYVNKLELSNEDLQRFAHVASHDLREPVRMISSYINLLEKRIAEQADGEVKEFIHFIKSGAHRMDGLIRDLLEYSKVTLNAAPHPVDLNTILQVVKVNLHELLLERNALLDLNDLPTVMADDTLMVQLFQNLIANGIKYNTHALPVVQVRFERVGRFYRFYVADNGIGIDPKFKEKVFEIFQRLHSREEYSGSGIGLSICKRIVENLGGEISVTNNIPEGSVFVFTLPA